MIDTVVSKQGVDAKIYQHFMSRFGMVAIERANLEYDKVNLFIWPI